MLLTSLVFRDTSKGSEVITERDKLQHVKHLKLPAPPSTAQTFGSYGLIFWLGVHYGYISGAITAIFLISTHKLRYRGLK